MKTYHKLAAAALGLCTIAAIVPARAVDNAATLEKTYIEGYQNKNHDTPIPIHVETPQVDDRIIAEDSPAFVTLEFVVDVKGRVTRIKIIDDSDFDLLDPVIDAVNEWQFSPALKDGQPVAKRVRLPIVFVKENDDGTIPPSPWSQKAVARVRLLPMTVLPDTDIVVKN